MENWQSPHFYWGGVLHSSSIDAYAAEYYADQLAEDTVIEQGDGIRIEALEVPWTENYLTININNTSATVINKTIDGQAYAYWEADKKYKVKKVESRKEINNNNTVIRYYFTVTLEEIIETPAPTPSDNNAASNDGTSDKKSSDEKTEIEYIDPFREFLDDMGQQVLNAPENGNVLIQTDTWVCFNRKALETLKTRPDVSLTVEYRYEGKYYTLTIPAGYNVDTLLDENGYAGFRWVDQFVGGHEIIK